MQLLGLPEEILGFILELSIRPLDPRVSLPDSQSTLTCRTLHRIGLPTLYHTLLLKSSSNADLVRRTLLERPTLVRHVRHIYSTVTSLSLLLVLRAIAHAKGSLQTLDFSINPPWLSGRLDDSDEEEPLAAVSVRQLAVRHGTVTKFLNRSLLEVANGLAEAIERWSNLEVAEIEPRMLLSTMPGGQPSPVSLALSRSPSLRLLRTDLPPAWDPALLVASENPNLKRIALTRTRLSSGSDGITSSYVDIAAASLVEEKDSHPWLMEAQHHHRLMELILAT